MSKETNEIRKMGIEKLRTLHRQLVQDPRGVSSLYWYMITGGLNKRAFKELKKEIETRVDNLRNYYLNLPKLDVQAMKEK